MNRTTAYALLVLGLLAAPALADRALRPEVPDRQGRGVLLAGGRRRASLLRDLGREAGGVGLPPGAHPAADGAARGRLPRPRREAREPGRDVHAGGRQDARGPRPLRGDDGVAGEDGRASGPPGRRLPGLRRRGRLPLRAPEAGGARPRGGALGGHALPVPGRPQGLGPAARLVHDQQRARVRADAAPRHQARDDRRPAAHHRDGRRAGGGPRRGQPAQVVGPPLRPRRGRERLAPAHPRHEARPAALLARRRGARGPAPRLALARADAGRQAGGPRGVHDPHPPRRPERDRRHRRG